jgi:hypothetical protein
MTNPNDTTNYIGRPMNDWTTNPGWGAYVVTESGLSVEDPDAGLAAGDGLDNDLDSSIDEQGEVYAELATRQAGDDIVDYPWAKVRYKLNATNQVLLFGDHDSDISTPPQVNLVRGFPMLIVTSEGEQGSSNRVVEVEAVKYPFQTVNAAIYCEDDNFKFNGTQFQISGEDWDPVTEAIIPGNPEVPAIATTLDPSKIAGELKGNQVNNVVGEGAEPSVLPATVDLDLEAMRDAYAPMATSVLSGGTYSNSTWGGYDDYRIVHCTGDMHTSGQCTGGGLLIVDGDFDCSGQFLWYGLVLVLGDIRFTGGGAGIHIYGSVLAQGGVTQQVVGGNADVLFSSASLARLAILSPYVVSSWRER